MFSIKYKYQYVIDIFISYWLLVTPLIVIVLLLPCSLTRMSVVSLHMTASPRFTGCPSWMVVSGCCCSRRTLLWWPRHGRRRSWSSLNRKWMCHCRTWDSRWSTTPAGRKLPMWELPGELWSFNLTCLVFMLIELKFRILWFTFGVELIQWVFKPGWFHWEMAGHWVMAGHGWVGSLVRAVMPVFI